MAGSLNKALLIGRLGKDPEVKYTQSGACVANLTVATDESYKDKSGAKVEKTEWHRVIAWNKQAEFCSKYLQKGALVYVEGSLETRSWEDQQGVKRYTTEIKAMRVQGIGSKPQGQQQAPAESGYKNQPTVDSEGMDEVPF